MPWVRRSMVKTGEIVQRHLATGSVGRDQLGSGSVGRLSLEDAVVDSDSLRSGSVGGAQLSGSANIRAATVTGSSVGTAFVGGLSTNDTLIGVFSISASYAAGPIAITISGSSEARFNTIVSGTGGGTGPAYGAHVSSSADGQPSLTGQTLLILFKSRDG